MYSITLASLRGATAQAPRFRGRSVYKGVRQLTCKIIDGDRGWDDEKIQVVVLDTSPRNSRIMTPGGVPNDGWRCTNNTTCGRRAKAVKLGKVRRLGEQRKAVDEYNAPRRPGISGNIAIPRCGLLGTPFSVFYSYH